MTGAQGTAADDSGSSQRRRSAARLAAVQALYEMDMVGAEADAVLTEFLQQRWRLDDAGGGPMVEPDGEWLGDLVNGVATRRGELDGLIGTALTKDLALERLETLLRVILRAGAYELSTKPDVPAAVVISEYVEVTHAFFDAKEAKLVNGVLDHLARELRAGER